MSRSCFLPFFFPPPPTVGFFAPGPGLADKCKYQSNHGINICRTLLLRSLLKGQGKKWSRPFGDFSPRFLFVLWGYVHEKNLNILRSDKRSNSTRSKTYISWFSWKFKSHTTGSQHENLAVDDLHFLIVLSKFGALLFQQNVVVVLVDKITKIDICTLAFFFAEIKVPQELAWLGLPFRVCDRNVAWWACKENP